LVIDVRSPLSAKCLSEMMLGIAVPRHFGGTSRAMGFCQALEAVDHCSPRRNGTMTWTKPEFAVVELGMEVGAYAGNA